MATQRRLVVPNVKYQIRSEAISGINLFPNEEVRTYFINQLTRLLKLCGYSCISWTLEENHYHLIVKTSTASISGFMRTLNSIFAKYLNKILGRRGTVFIRRFSSAIVDNFCGLKEIIRHIHLNPIRKGVCTIKTLDSYKYNSHSIVIQNKNTEFQNVKSLLSLFNDTNPLFAYTNYIRSDLSQCNRYNQVIKLLREANKKGQYYTSARCCIIGDPNFVNIIIAKDKFLSSLRPLNKKLGITLKKLYALSNTCISLKGSSKLKKRLVRGLFVLVGVNALEFSCAEIARFLNMSSSAVSRMISRLCGVAKSFYHSKPITYLCS
ncbi:hypothetical protein QA601_08255 [Chitinispirillales bacterium ANBcel5]|uniref:transposase n=1 Tax=Cellulosispirillum alkaliphilum TaxID=3039283 RepID=UPI002A594234|nr:hypothetical protein [Chitinispirillales bacterium ANBcel5]